MAIRVRKLAKELERSPAEVLGLLHAIGYEKYRSAEDQVPDVAVQRVRVAIRKGVRPLPVVLVESPRSSPPSSEPPRADVMSSLVPGVVPVGARPPATRPPAPRITPPRPSKAPDTTPDPRAGLERDRAALAAARAAFEAESAAERARWAARSAALPERPTLAAFLGERGLDSGGGLRAVAARLADLMPHLSVIDAAAVAAALAGLSAGDPDSSEVSPDVEKALGRLAERLMLLGLRRVVVVGGTAPLLKRLRELLDPRIDVRFRGVDGTARARPDAELDVTRSDVVVLWGVPISSEAAQVYDTSRAVVVQVSTSDLAGLVAEVGRRLDEV